MRIFQRKIEITYLLLVAGMVTSGYGVVIAARDCKKPDQSAEFCEDVETFSVGLDTESPEGDMIS